jgi:queuosine precursor transporter
MASNIYDMMFITEKKSGNSIDKRREMVFILLSGIFIGTLAMMNILGISRLLDFSFSAFGLTIPFMVFIGVLPYPITFLCTDIISEFYGKRRATYVVWTGFVLNLWVLFILWIGGKMPPNPIMDPVTNLPLSGDPSYVFFQVRNWAFGATSASMIAYLTAQFVDVHVFHYLKKKAPKQLWIRNNGSTLTSQLIDSLAVVLITFFTTNAIRVEDGQNVVQLLVVLILSNYAFKFIAAVVDTLPFYVSVKYLSKFLKTDPRKENL